MGKKCPNSRDAKNSIFISGEGKGVVVKLRATKQAGQLMGVGGGKRCQIKGF